MNSKGNRLRRNLSEYEKQHSFVNLPDELQRRYVNSLNEAYEQDEIWGEDEESYISNQDLANDLQLDNAKEKLDAKQIVSRASFIAGLVRTNIPASAIIGNSKRIERLRISCCEMMLELTAHYSLFQYEQESCLKYLESQHANVRSFLQMFLQTQLWACFQQDITEGGMAPHREMSLVFFKTLVNMCLSLQRVRICAEQVDLHEFPKLDSCVVGSLYKGDIVYVVLKKDLSSSTKTRPLSWMKIRDMEGWALLNSSNDIENLEQSNTIDYMQLHGFQNNSKVYPFENELRIFRRELVS